MATSPNYSWPEPDNTDLVKNGALAMRTLGNAIDTTMATMTPKSTVTAKGSLIAATAASTPANLAVGNNGETLVADSSTTTGLRYTAGTVQSNPVLNSAFQVWQRGTANVTTALAYTADRWQKNASTHYGVSRQATGDTTNLPFIQYCARVQRTSGSGVTSGMEFVQNLESINSVPYAGKTVTVSFYARAGANYSATSNFLNVSLYTGTGTDQNLIVSPYFTGSTQAISVTATLTTTWQRFTGTATLGSTVTQMAVYSVATPTGTAGANDYFEITGVQIDIGSVALPFRTYAGTIQGELAACQRYGYALNQVNPSGAVGSGFNYSTTQGLIYATLPVPMRSVPTVTYTTPTGAFVYNAIGTQIATTAMSGTNHSTTTLYIVTSVASGLVAGNGNVMITGAGTSQILFASAEL